MKWIDKIKATIAYNELMKEEYKPHLKLAAQETVAVAAFLAGSMLAYGQMYFFIWAMPLPLAIIWLLMSVFFIWRTYRVFKEQSQGYAEVVSEIANNMGSTK